MAVSACASIGVLRSRAELKKRKSRRLRAAILKYARAQHGFGLPTSQFPKEWGIRPARYDDLLTIRTTLRQWPADHRVEFHQEVFNEEGKLLTTGKVVLYFLKAGTMEKTTMPAEMEKRLKPYFG